MTVVELSGSGVMLSRRRALQCAGAAAVTIPMRPRRGTTLAAASTLALALALMLCAAAAMTVVRAADLFVAPNGSDGNACTSLLAPCASVHAAVERAQRYDTIRFAGGVYTNQCAPNVTVVRVPLSFVGGIFGAGDDPHAVTIDCGGSGGFLHILDSSVLVSGMTIVRADSLQAGAIFMELSVPQPAYRPYNMTFRYVNFLSNTGRSDHMSGMAAGAVAIVYNVLGSVHDSTHVFDHCLFDGNTASAGMLNSDATLVSAAGAVLIHVRASGGQLGGAVITGVTHRFAYTTFNANTMPFIPTNGVLSTGAHSVAIVHDANGENSRNDVVWSNCQTTNTLGEGFVGSGNSANPVNLVLSGGLAVSMTSQTGPNSNLHILIDQSLFSNVTSMGAIMYGGAVVAPAVSVGMFAFRNNQHGMVRVTGSVFFNCPDQSPILSNGGPGILSGAIAAWYNTLINDNYNLTTSVESSNFELLEGGDAGVHCIPTSVNSAQTPCTAVAAGAVAIHYTATIACTQLVQAFLDTNFLGVWGGSNLEAGPFMVGGGAIAIMQQGLMQDGALTVMTGCNASSVFGGMTMSGQAGQPFIMSASAFFALLVGGQSAQNQVVRMTNTQVSGTIGATGLSGTPLAAAAAGVLSVLMSAGTNDRHVIDVRNSQFTYNVAYQSSGFMLATGTSFAGAGGFAALWVQQIVAFSQSPVSTLSETSYISVRFTGCDFEENVGPQTNTPLYTFALAGAIALQYSTNDQVTGVLPSMGTNSYDTLLVDSCHFYNNSAGNAYASADEAASMGGAIAVLYTATGGNTFCTHRFHETAFKFNAHYNPLSAAGAVMLYIDSAVSASNVVDFTECEFLENTGSLGGGLSVVTQAFSAVTTTVMRTDFNGNDALCQSTTCCCSGGGASFTSGTFAISNSSFVRNHATYSGGAVWTGADATGTIMYSTFSVDEADSFGDELHAASSGTIVISDTRMSFNGSDAQDASDSTVAIAALKSLLHVENTTQLVCPVGNTVYLSRNFYGCQYCPQKSYLVLPGNWVDPPNGPSTPCKPCPYGADCGGGAMVATSAGYWATLDAHGNLSTTACPDGYCCLGASTCAWQEACTSTNRDGVLCGSCLEGYSETIGSTRCRPTATCHDAYWFFPLFFIAASILFAYFFLSSPKSSGLAAIIGFFYQCVGMLFAQSAASDVFGDTLTSLFDFRVETGSGSGICAFPGLTALGKQFVWLLTPLCLLVPLCFVLLYYVLVDKCCPRIVESDAGPAGLGPFDSVASSHGGSGGHRGGGDSLFSSVRSSSPASVPQAPPSSTMFGPSSLGGGGITAASSPVVHGTGAGSMSLQHMGVTVGASALLDVKTSAPQHNSNAANRSMRMSPLVIGAGTPGLGGVVGAGSMGTIGSGSGGGVDSPAAGAAATSTPLSSSFKLEGAAMTTVTGGDAANPLLASGQSGSGGTVSSGDVKTGDALFASASSGNASSRFASGSNDSGSGETTVEKAAAAAEKQQLSQPLLTGGGAGAINSSGGPGVVPRGLHSISSSWGGGGGTVTLTKVKHLRSRGPHFAAALTNIFVYTYSSVVKAVFVLLHCVPINGLDGLYLFESAVTRCYQGWQFVLIVVLVVLALIPCAILWYSLSSARNLHPTNLARRAMFDVLFSPYAAHAVPWNAVLLLQRFVLIVLDTFLVVANTRVQVLTSICVLFLMLHVMVQPFHRPSMNRFQLLCLALLVLIGLSNAPAASLLTSGYPSNDTTTNAFSILAAVQSAFLALPFGIAFVIWVRAKLREYYVRQKAAAKIAQDLADRHAKASGTGGATATYARQKPSTQHVARLGINSTGGGSGYNAPAAVLSSSVPKSAAKPLGAPRHVASSRAARASVSGYTPTAAPANAAAYRPKRATISLVSGPPVISEAPASSTAATSAAASAAAAAGGDGDTLRVPLLNSV